MRDVIPGGQVWMSAVRASFQSWAGGTEAVDGGMQGDHRGGGGFSSGVGVESAMYGVAAVQQGSQPARIRAGS